MSINAKFGKSDRQTNFDKYRVTINKRLKIPDIFRIAISAKV